MPPPRPPRPPAAAAPAPLGAPPPLPRAAPPAPRAAPAAPGAAAPGAPAPRAAPPPPPPRSQTPLKSGNLARAAQSAGVGALVTNCWAVATNPAAITRAAPVTTATILLWLFMAAKTNTSCAASGEKPFRSGNRGCNLRAAPEHHLRPRCRRLFFLARPIQD